MEKEYVSKTQMGSYNKLVVAALLGFFPLIGIILIVLAFFVSYLSYLDGNITIYAALFRFGYIFSIAVLCFAIGWVFISVGLAQYRFTNDGLFVKYPFRRESLISWFEFQQICICYAAYTTRGTPRANTVICCVKKNERHNSMGRWKTDNPFRYRTVICIDFSPALMNGLMDVYPGNVVDLRDTPAYRLRK